ncbi:tRNA-uridine aminocarboxypropyltransferase [Serpens gallinarum]|jgi:DTW domain-containing protein YfiP|uniref:tRNA-uridine aminocarboxypropyltransferase n=1 Tax=Serpens gallinarum TaxID=2763075 RepID=A0ABR8TRY9_9PSED|nr:DTW domain-containing protein [Serpens gallinarum]MBD7978059.1 DTW domain-containing protein [Serpens gallinarum]
MPRPTCSQCCRPLAYCLCALVSRLDSRTRVLILQHPSEAGHALNTARLAALGLENAELRIGEHFADLADLLADPGYDARLLFPGDEAELPSQQRAEQRPLLLVVPDGTWRKARKLLYCNPLLEHLPRLTLPEGLESRYRLRKAPKVGALSTLEAITETLNRLEAPRRFDALLRPFEALIDGQIAAMGEEVFQRNHG